MIWVRPGREGLVRPAKRECLSMEGYMGGSRRAAAVKALADMRGLSSPVEAAEGSFTFLGFAYEFHGCDGYVFGCVGAA